MINKSLLLALSLFFAGPYAFGQTQPKAMYLRLDKSKLDTNRINILLQIGKYYKGEIEGVARNVDTGLFYAKQALQLSQKLKNLDKEMQSRSLLSGLYFKKRDVDQGRGYALQVINYYHQTQNTRQEARYVQQYSWDMPISTQEELAENIKWYGTATRLYDQAHDPVAQLQVVTRIASLHIKQENLDLAEQELLGVIKGYNAIGYNKLVKVYELLGIISIRRGDLNKELEYQLKLIDNMEATADTSDAGTYYYNLAQNYYLLGMHDKCIAWATKGMQAGKQSNDGDILYSNMHLVHQSLLKKNEPLKALQLIQKTAMDFKPVTITQKSTMYLDIGNCYQNLRQFDKAEPNYLRNDSLFNEETKGQSIVNDPENANNFIGHYINMGGFYVDFGEFKKAAFFLNKAALIPQGVIYPSTIRKLEFYRFKTDSAFGNYIPAMRHYQRYKAINDSLYNATQSKQFAEMNAKYETGKKEQQIKILQDREQQAMLQGNLKQAELQKVSLQRDIQTGQLKQVSLERNIQSATLQKVILQRKAEEQKADFQRNIQAGEIQKVNMQRNITFVGVAMLLVVSGLAYNGYLNKQRSNVKLQSQQIEINRQNDGLQQLLTEKDWLLKEVHHRVKNNLQIVMSLLSTQSAYLQNSDALEAIRESQNRVQSIALIHQKLYSTSNVASIDMSSYITDLVSYLRDGFNTAKQGIHFEQIIEPIKIDLVQAVPLGLILNEAITNAIKYAFPHRSGEIVIGMQVIQQDIILLTIADNGKGLPDDFDIRTASSLGMEMMKALSKQLGGNFEIKSKLGTMITIEFKLEQLLTRDQKEKIYN